MRLVAEAKTKIVSLWDPGVRIVGSEASEPVEQVGDLNERRVQDPLDDFRRERSFEGEGGDVAANSSKDSEKRVALWEETRCGLAELCCGKDAVVGVRQWRI